MPLSLAIATGSPVSIYRQIVDQVCAAVVAGRLEEDEPLPSVRSLADQLVVNPNTVARAYSELAREGIVESRAGKGMFVAPRRQMYSRPERLRRIEPSLHTFVSEALLLGFGPEEIVEQVKAKAEELSPNRKDRSPKGGGASR
jgi:GntR family transcriptional regulator